ncbi:CDP-alcohol phosphatidyltransferase family protein [Aegicerativicinus sediminis]|uniref:CDP-alcohol phosphatidyltransferase family protein n=1 Tax=Aegicerativicinus sediminis TaxID=2893202 RepID=UPI001E5270EA|nr:CDP-alcohol phosphatidyltransferase family protein [Aegicerativicinus sediminis]
MNIFKKFNIADWFSFYRIVVSPLLVIFIWFDLRLYFTWFLLISFCTDMIDGYLARKLNLISPRGSQLDSVGDQITLVVGIIGIYRFEAEFVKANLVLILIVFMPYFIQMVYAYLKYGRATSFHTYLAKLSAILQGIFVISSLFFSPSYALFYAVIVFSLVETFEEITLIYMYDNWASDVKGIYWALRDKRRQNNSNQNNK